MPSHATLAFLLAVLAAASAVPFPEQCTDAVIAPLSACAQSAFASGDSHDNFIQSCCGLASVFFDKCGSDPETLINAGFYVDQPYRDYLASALFDCPGA